MPEATRREDELNGSTSDIVHYTTAETAIKIINDQRLWMRNAILLNDHSEISCGNKLLNEAWALGLGHRLVEALNDVHPGSGQKVAAGYDQGYAGLLLNTYIACVSEHLVSENRFGRLSMWRAYGGRTGVAIVVDKAALFEGDPGLHTYASPVSYASQEEFNGQFTEVVQNIEGSKDFLRAIEEDELVRTMVRVLRFAVVSTKHPGFREEREWRVIHSPVGFNSSDKIKPEDRTICGVPQRIHILPLQNVDRVKRIIIGPTEHSLALLNAFAFALENKGVADARSRICISDIPLRHSS